MSEENEAVNDTLIKLHQQGQFEQYRPQDEHFQAPFTQKDKQMLIENYKRDGIEDYEPTKLTTQEIAEIVKTIDTSVQTTTDPQDIDALHELREYIQTTGAIFPELSHGTSSDALPTILKHGIVPRLEAQTYQSPWMQQFGEGNKTNKKRTDEQSQEVMLGLGQGGLGTAIAYAETIDNPGWNPNHLTREQIEAGLEQINKRQDQLLRRKYTPDTQEYERLDYYTRRERIDKALETLQVQQDALTHARIRRILEKEPDFPLIIGADRIDKRGGPFPMHRQYSILTDNKKYHWDKGIFSRTLKRDEALDSEVVLEKNARVQPQEIKVVACPKDKKEEVNEMLIEGKRPGITVVSLEALRMLPKIGAAPRIEQARQKAERLLKMVPHNQTVDLLLAS